METGDNSPEEAMPEQNLEPLKVHSREDKGISNDGDDTYKGQVFIRNSGFLLMGMVVL